MVYRSFQRHVAIVAHCPPSPSAAHRGARSIPKGEVGAGEDLLAAARRELAEETDFAADGPALALGAIRQASGKIVHAWAIEGDADPSRLRCNPFEIEWPRGSGRRQSFAELDRAAWREKLVPAQVALVERLVARLAGAASPT